VYVYSIPVFKRFRRNNTVISCWYHKKRRLKQLSTSVQNFAGRTQTGKKCLLSKGNYRSRYVCRILNYSFKYFKALSMLVTVQNNSKSRQHAGLFVNSFGCWFYSLFPSSVSTLDYYKIYNKDSKFLSIRQYITIWPRALNEFNQFSKISFIESGDGRVIFSRSAGTHSLLLKNDYYNLFAIVILPSKKLKLFFNKALAFYGIVGSYIKNRNFVKKAGYFVKRGRKPTVRGTVKNSCDHPNGGRTRALKLSRTPWCKVAKKSRKPKLVLKIRTKDKRVLKSKNRFKQHRASYFDIKDSYYINMIRENF
jgi:hypothetical protein